MALPESGEKCRQTLVQRQQKKAANVTINAMNMLPENKDYYRFNGSLTTPPCSEGVRWMVLKEAAQASEAQIKKFHSTFHGDTNRPVQAINARPVLK